MLFLHETCIVLDLIDMRQCNLHNDITNAGALSESVYRHLSLRFWSEFTCSDYVFLNFFKSTKWNGSILYSLRVKVSAPFFDSWEEVEKENQYLFWILCLHWEELDLVSNSPRILLYLVKVNIPLSSNTY